ncbi:class I SAM-dependent methyltransferase [Pseudomonas sp. ABC1]|uniref:class I SAM-dependent methyltransferase n=1 Tax=Pseudomonas sp. ABC1 TaxID=2748080 RepID=UPI0015C3B6AE|nr:TylF/MycF/NovP-related O-methyltransferase [Pseudomonas sp. ABC1]QLF92472.1 class I SAM-dependent methyltransferase [Pseudomonas sp. ABC1]
MKLYMGSREYKPEGYLTVDLDGSYTPDIVADVCCLSMIKSETVDEVYASHVLEHLAWPDSYKALAEWARVLKPGGVLKVSVPDLKMLCSLLMNGVNPAFCLGLMYGEPYRGELAAHRYGYTRETLSEMLGVLGFDDFDTWESDIPDASNGWMYVQDAEQVAIALNIACRKKREPLVVLNELFPVLAGNLTVPFMSAVRELLSEREEPIGRVDIAAVTQQRLMFKLIETRRNVTFLKEENARLESRVRRLEGQGRVIELKGGDTRENRREGAVFLFAPMSRLGGIYVDSVVAFYGNVVAVVDDWCQDALLCGVPRWSSDQFLAQAREYPDALIIDFSVSSKAWKWAVDICDAVGLRNCRFLDGLRAFHGLPGGESSTARIMPMIGKVASDGGRSHPGVISALWPEALMAGFPQRYFVNYEKYIAAAGQILPALDVKPYIEGNENNTLDMARFFNFCLIFDQIEKEGITGHMAELGVYKGNTAAVIASFARRLGRQAYFLDTYEGFSRDDLTGPDRDQAIQFQDTSLEKVKALVGEESAFFIKGFFPETRSALPNDVQYSLVHLDCDLYAPMLAGLEYFYPLMSPGGFIIMHDYSSLYWPGAEKAIDEFFSDKLEYIVPVADCSGSVIVRKVAAS